MVREQTWCEVDEAEVDAGRKKSEIRRANAQRWKSKLGVERMSDAERCQASGGGEERKDASGCPGQAETALSQQMGRRFKSASADRLTWSRDQAVGESGNGG